MVAQPCGTELTWTWVITENGMHPKSNGSSRSSRSRFNGKWRQNVLLDRTNLVFLKLWRERLPCSLQATGPPIHWGVPERLLLAWREKGPLVDWALVKTAAAPASPGLVLCSWRGEIVWVFIGRGTGAQGVAVQPAPRCVAEAPRRPDRNKPPDDPGRAQRH